MAKTFGDVNPALTSAIRRVAKGETKQLRWLTHALEEMDKDGFDQGEVLTCLRKGHAYGPEFLEGQFRANVIHQGLNVRVVVGPVGPEKEDWAKLTSLSVITVMKDK